MRADWPRSPRVGALVSLRGGGVSTGPFAAADGSGGLNLGDHVGDDPACVAANRARVAAHVPAPVRWLEQVHGVTVADLDHAPPDAPPPLADAAVTTRTDRVLAVLTADCLPILLADADGAVIGVAHAGWRGLAAGVAEALVGAMHTRSRAPLTAWLGPAIGPQAFEVGDEVRQAFADVDPLAHSAFAPGPRAGKWLADLYRLARLRLARVGVTDVHGGGLCTVGDPVRFWSHRRDRRSGRMASLVWRIAP